jgi:glycine/D-amino acid oxidase-like deaminating enzyme
VVVGGVMGCSIAFHLAERGVDTLVLERGTVCSGMTARSGARKQLVRMHYRYRHCESSSLCRIPCSGFLAPLRGSVLVSRVSAT